MIFANLLVMVRRMTAELRRQGVAVWKKVIPVLAARAGGGHLPAAGAVASPHPRWTCRTGSIQPPPAGDAYGAVGVFGAALTVR